MKKKRKKEIKRKSNLRRYFKINYFFSKKLLQFISVFIEEASGPVTRT